jgi:hydroxymethylpyrimidine/phosphomethylpyrimidine kinase
MTQIALRIPGSDPSGWAGIRGRPSRRSGCTLSAVIPAGLAPEDAVVAKNYMTAAIAAPARLSIGSRRGPLNHVRAWELSASTIPPPALHRGAAKPAPTW